MECEYCQKKFIRKSIRHPNQRFCSKECAKKVWIIKNIQKNREYKTKYRNKVKNLPETKEKRGRQWKSWYERNKEKRKDLKKEQDKKYYLKNMENLQEKAKKYYQEHKSERNKYICNRLKTDKNFRIACRLRGSLRKALKTYSIGKKFPSSKYGINYKEIIKHLKPFPNNIKDYHVDHIKPLCSFNLTDPEQVKIAFAPENHQWLLAEENLIKGGRI